MVERGGRARLKVGDAGLQVVRPLLGKAPRGAQAGGVGPNKPAGRAAGKAAELGAGFGRCRSHPEAGIGTCCYPTERRTDSVEASSAAAVAAGACR